MQAKRLTLFVAVIASLAAVPMAYPVTAFAADAAAIQPKDGWYTKALVDYDFMRQNVSIPPKKGVVIIDSRPAARQYDPGHIPGAINIPDSQFDKLVDKLPADKATLLLFYCGGLECMLSHNSAFKAEKLGYTNIKVYPAGSPEWKAKGAQMSVSAAYIKKLIDDKAPYVLIDARPKRVADKGMIPTAINISDTEFDKQVDKLPADKATLLIYYCGGLECVLSDNSAEKAKKLGYTNVLTYPPGYPEWEKLHGAPAAAMAAMARRGCMASGRRRLGGAGAGQGKGLGHGRLLRAGLEGRIPGSVMLVDVRDRRKSLRHDQGLGEHPDERAGEEDRHAADRQAGGLRLRHRRALGRGLRHGEAARRQGAGLLPRRRRQVQCRRQLHHGGEEVVTEFQRLYTGRLWSVMGWDQLTAFWQRIDPAAGWYLVAVGVSPAPTSGMHRPMPPRQRLHRAHRCPAAGGAPRILLRHRLCRRPRKPAPDQDLRSEQPRIFLWLVENPPGPGWIMSRLPPDEIWVATRPRRKTEALVAGPLLGDS
jgi:rhodanese-related sulfurtransferase